MDAYEKYDNGELLNGRYAKVADISEGSYGLVSLARDTKRNDAYVAVKYIYPMDYPRKKLMRQLSSATGRATSSPAKLRSNVDDDSRRKSVMTALLEESAKEISFHKLLGHHINIPDLIDSFGSCLVLEYCSRGDLYEAMQNDIGPTTSQDIKDVFSQVLNALTFCHSKSVFHRDLKPENILISDDWTIKICDWGLATTERIVTNKNEFDVGSERYMAPELFDLDLESYDASKVDLWSLGVILLTLVFHKNPFQVANYTDKRFLQFSANREALFDFFSTMTAELFGALRFCLNMDPSNRDLEGLTRELENVRYFTIDEEYWAEHSDEEEDEEDDGGYDPDLEDERSREPEKLNVTDHTKDPEEFEFEEDMFGFEKEPAEELPKELSVIQDVSEHLEDPASPVRAVNRHIRLDLDDATDSDATTNTYAISREHSEMPHNRRADALLSPFTHMKPIPITGNLQIRNTRKPFGVASYNKNGTYSSSTKPWTHGNNHQAGSHGNKFRREDFFTPRSTFTQYMDKYGEQREQRDFMRGNDRNGDKKKKWNRGRKKQSWKKRTQKVQNAPAESNNRRRYSNTHKRRLSVKPSSHNLPMSHSPTSTLGRANGKYVPPFMRAKSPVLGGLTENLGHLHLNDDELFQLDDDYNHNNQSQTNSHQNLHQIHHGINLIQHQPHSHNHGNGIHSHSNSHHVSNGGHNIGLVHGHNSSHSQGFVSHEDSGRVSFSHRYMMNDQDSRRVPQSSTHAQFIDNPALLFFGRRSDSQTGGHSRRHLAGRSNSSGKYVPPFRRGSCSAAGVKQEKRRPIASGGVFPSIQQTLMDNETSRSVPGDNWLAKKEWRS